MGDFLLDFRAPEQRRLAQAAELLRFRPYSQVVTFDQPEFGLVVTWTEASQLWEPFRAADGTVSAVAGRVALDAAEWEMAERVPGPGGLAGKAVYRRYRDSGLAGLVEIGGNCVLLIFDPQTREFHVITDRTGVFPAFRVEAGSKLVFGSHPDVLAAVAGEREDLDEASVAEFLMTSTVTPPHTYYRRVRSMDHASVTTVQTGPAGAQVKHCRRYFDFRLQFESGKTEADLAEELAEALKKAVRRRTGARFGRTALALSGGLDSRAILACVENPESVFAFCCYDAPNRELAAARAIAAARRVRFLAWQRPFDYYGDNARAGVRISGGMGTFANNHFLGVLPRVREEGAQNLLTGCYCDYLFKGLPLNRRAHWLTGREELAPFRHQFYFGHTVRTTPFAPQIRERLESRVPAEYQAQDVPEKVFQVEVRRTFPLCYEGDNQQRVVPQRLAGWYLPMADKDVMDVYRKIPWHFKLNRSVYTKAVRRLCVGPMASVADANTGSRPGAPLWAEALTANWARLRRKFRRKERMATDGSWPDWHYYVGRSPRLAELWQRPNARATDLFQRILQPGDIRPTPADYAGRDTFFFVPLLTIKLWCDEWHAP